MPSPTVFGQKVEIPTAVAVTLPPLVETGNLPVSVDQTAIVALTVEKALACAPVALTSAQRMRAVEKLRPLDIRTMSQLAIAELEAEADRAFTAVLNAFLEKIQRADDPRLFALFSQLQKDVDKAKLGDLADKILTGDVGLLEKAKAFFTRNGLAKAAEAAREELSNLVRSTTSTLAGEIRKSSEELDKKLGALRTEVGTQEDIKNAYRERLADFTLAAAVTRAFVEMSRSVVQEAETKLAQTVNPSPEQQAEVEELRARLQIADSCAIAKEGTLTRLSADQLVIRQLQDAAIATYIETLVTASSRYNSIRMTLLTIHGALQVKNVQDLQRAGASLDQNLANVRGKLMTDVVTAAANAPGDNRVAQAKQIKDIVTEVGEIQKIVATARTANEQKFLAARTSLEESRHAMVELAKQVRPQVAAKL